MNTLRLNTCIALTCCVTSILLNGCGGSAREIKDLYQCSKDMVDGYCLNSIYVDTLSEDTLVFTTGTADNYYDDVLVDVEHEGWSKFRLVFDMERYKMVLVTGNIVIEYFLQTKKSSDQRGQAILDGLEINMYASSSNTNPLVVILADQYKNTDCSNVDDGNYIGKNEYPYSNYVKDHIQFTYYDSIALNNIYYYKVYFQGTGSNILNKYFIYFTKDEGVIGFKTPDGKFYMQQ